MSNLAQRISAFSYNEQTTVPDAPIDYSVPYKSRERGSARHFGFFPFFAKKPWPVVQEYIKHYTAPGELVCDPFAGSGVTSVESLVLGRRTVASDINPVARFITQMTAVAPVDLRALQHAYEQVRRAAQEPIEALNLMADSEIFALLRTLTYPRNLIPVTVRRAGAETVDELHTPRQLAGLTILRDAINRVEDLLLRNLLRVALANTVRYANKMYILPFDKGKRRSPYRGDVGFLRRASYSLATAERFYEHAVWPTFEHVFRSVVRAKQETNDLIDSWYSDTNFVLADVVASRIHEITGEGAVDYCFTDPPYSNQIYFVDLSTLWAAWLELKITDENRQAELLIDSKQGKPRQLFEHEFAASMESIARSLKNERWFTLVYKHRDLSLWQTIVAACEESGLRYVNAVWQDVVIRSTRQIESPNINPKGDMYLNFRKMSPRRFEQIYRPSQVLDLPTRPNYVEHEVERIIVSYLGADIELIAATVIQQVLDSRVFREYQENPASLAKDIQQVLKGPRFDTWHLYNNQTLWVISPRTPLDSSLPMIDRARYHVFEFLRERGGTTEGEVTQHVLIRLAEERGGHTDGLDIPSLLRSVGQEIEPRRWRFEAAKVADYKQLRLLFGPSKADELRERIEQQSVQPNDPPLRLSFENIAVLRDRLREANTSNKLFTSQYDQLQEVLKTILWRLRDGYKDQIEQVLAVGDWAQEGIDLRNLPLEDVLLHIVVRSDKRSFELYKQLAENVFNNIDDEEIFVQFEIETLTEWNQSLAVARASEQEHALGLPLLTRIW